MPRARCCVVESVRLDQPRRGALLLALSGLLFAIMGVLIREVSTGVNNETVVFARNLIGVFYFLPLMLIHQIQLMVCAVLAERYGRRAETGAEEAA